MSLQEIKKDFPILENRKIVIREVIMSDYNRVKTVYI